VRQERKTLISSLSLASPSKSKVMSSKQLSPFSFLSANYQFNKDDKIRYLMLGVRLSILANVVFMILGLFIRIDLSILTGLMLIPCLIAWLLLRKNLHETAIHVMSTGYAFALLISPWLIGPTYAPILVYVFILFVANLIFHSQTVKTLYIAVVFLCIYAYILGNINTTKLELPYIQFVEFGVLIFVMSFIMIALNVFILDIENFKQQLREREIFLDNMINSSPNAVFVKNDKLQIVLVNDKFVEIQGRPREAFIGKTAVEIQGKFEGYEQIEAEDKAILAGEKQVIGHIVTGIEDGKQMWFEYNITQEKLQEIALKEKNEQLEKYIESNMQLENFAHIASHDLREPIRSVVSFGQLLKRKAADKLDKDESEYLDFIITASKNMTELINDLLAYALVDSQKPTFKDTQLEPLLEAILLQMQTAIGEKQATINYNNLPEKIYGNPTQIAQLFQNLIANGIKFNRPGVPPVLTIFVKEVGHHWQFSVSDNGIGIAPEYHQRIFLLFRRLHTREVYKGSGVGLATCKKIVDLHQGKIWIESQEGQGTTFHFTIRKNLDATHSDIPNDTPQVS